MFRAAGMYEDLFSPTSSYLYFDNMKQTNWAQMFNKMSANIRLYYCVIVLPRIH